MIRIYEYSQVDPAAIFQRETPISRVTPQSAPATPGFP